MNRDKIITFYDSLFHKKLLKRYQSNFRNPFKLPSLIFYKKTGNILFGKLDIHFLRQFHFFTRNIFFSLNLTNLKSFQNINRQFTDFRTHKNLTWLILKPYFLSFYHLFHGIRQIQKQIALKYAPAAKKFFDFPSLFFSEKMIGGLQNAKNLFCESRPDRSIGYLMDKPAPIESIKNKKWLYLWFGTERSVIESVLKIKPQMAYRRFDIFETVKSEPKPIPLQDIKKNESILSLGLLNHSVFSWLKNIAFVLRKIPRPVVYSVDAAFHLNHSIHDLMTDNILHIRGGKKPNDARVIKIHSKNTPNTIFQKTFHHFLSQQVFLRKNMSRVDFLAGTESTSLMAKCYLSPKHLSIMAESKYFNTRNSFINHNHRDGLQGSSDSEALRTGFAFRKERNALFFRKQPEFDHSIEELKKIIIEKKKVPEENLLSPNFFLDKKWNKLINQHLDMNMISEEVYQHLKKRIRFERERRGI